MKAAEWEAASVRRWLRVRVWTGGGDVDGMRRRMRTGRMTDTDCVSVSGAEEISLEKKAGREGETHFARSEPPATT